MSELEGLKLLRRIDEGVAGKSAEARAFYDQLTALAAQYDTSALRRTLVRWRDADSLDSESSSRTACPRPDRGRGSSPLTPQ